MNTRFFLRKPAASGVAASTLAVLLAMLPCTAAAADAQAPARVVSLTPSITETLFALGLGSRVVGVSTSCDWPPEAASLPKAGSFSEPVAEAIVALHPDLVLTSPSPGNETAVRAIERSGVKVAVVGGDGSVADVKRAILDVGRAAGAAAAAEALVAGLDARLEAVRGRAAALPHPATAVVVGREPLVLAGPASYLGELLALAGGANVADKVGGRWPRVGMEFLVVQAPEVLFDLSLSMGENAAGGTPGDRTAGWAGASSIPAVAHGRVVGDTASVLLRPGPRLAEAAEALFVGLHPEAAAGVPGAGAPPAEAPSAGAASAGRAP